MIGLVAMTGRNRIKIQSLFSQKTQSSSKSIFVLTKQTMSKLDRWCIWKWVTVDPISVCVCVCVSVCVCVCASYYRVKSTYLYMDESIHRWFNVYVKSMCWHFYTSIWRWCLWHLFWFENAPSIDIAIDIYIDDDKHVHWCQRANVSCLAGYQVLSPLLRPSCGDECIISL